MRVSTNREGPILGSLCEGFFAFASVVGAPNLSCPENGKLDSSQMRQQKPSTMPVHTAFSVCSSWRWGMLRFHTPQPTLFIHKFLSLPFLNSAGYGSCGPLELLIV